MHREIGTIGGIVEYLVSRGIEVGIASELVAKVFGWGVDASKYRLPENLVAPQIKVDAPQGQMSLIGEVGPRKPTQPKKAPHRIPDDYALTPDLKSYAVERGFTEVEIDSMFRKFKNHFLGNGETSPRWDAKWRTWVERGVEYKTRDARQRQTSLMDGRL